MVSLVGFALWLLLSRLTQAGLVNVTIDDSSANPRNGRSIIYSPSTSWNTRSHCQAINCNAVPDSRIVSSRTWHEATYDPKHATTPITASFEFEGSAVYIYCVLATSISFPSGNSDMSFSIDGQVVGSFVRPAAGPWGYKYNVPVYSNSALSPGHHKLDITNGHIGTTKGQTLLMLDHIVYSFEEQSAPTTPTTTTVVVPPPANPGTSIPPPNPTIPTPEVPVTGITGSPPSPLSSSPAIASSGHPIPPLTTLNSPTNPASPTSPFTNGAAPTDPTLPVDPSQPPAPPSPQSFTPSRGRNIGAALGTSLSLLALGLILCLLCRRRRRRRARTAAMRASRTYQIAQVGAPITADGRSSLRRPTLVDPFAPTQTPLPMHSRRTIAFAGVASPVNSPMSPGEGDPFVAFGGHGAEASGRGAGQRWTVGSDSKRALLEARAAPPPAYHAHN